MNTTSKRVLAALAIVGLLVGCSTTRQEKSAQAASSMGDLHKLLSQGAAQATKLKVAAGELSAVKTDDLRKSYDRFAEESKDLRSIADDARGQSAAMNKSAKAYFGNWEKELAEISNSDLKKMSKDRQAVLEREYEQITSAMNGLRKAYTAFENDLTDIEKFLGNDLTRNGSDLAKPYLAKLGSEADTVIAATQKAEAAITHLETILKPK